MWEQLRKKYGPEPPSSSGPATMTQEERLTRFYAHYAPQKTGADIETAIHRYATEPGGYDAMWQQLTTKYGPEVPSGAVRSPGQSPPPQDVVSQQKERLRKFYARYAPQKTESDVETAVNRYAHEPGGYDAMWQQLTTKYGPEVPSGAVRSPGQSPPPQDVVSQQKERLRKFYSRYAPQKTESDIETAVNRYAHEPGGYDAMWQQLTTKYGPEVPSGKPVTPPPMAIPTTPPPEADLGADPLWMTHEDKQQKARLRAFYSKYAPQKTDNDLNVALQKYHDAEGGYSLMWQHLEAKYGPESGTSNATAPLPAVMSMAPSVVRDGSAAEVKEAHRRRLKEFYDSFCPGTKSWSDIDTALTRYENVPGGYNAMWDALKTKYNVSESQLPPLQGGC